jgi:hypothetical protein
MPADAGRIVHDELVRAMNRGLDRLLEGVKPYPPPPTGSRYHRRYWLGKSLTVRGDPKGIRTVRDIPGGVEGRWGTKVEYARWVIGEGTQAWMHKGRWWTLQGEAQRLFPKVKAEFDAAGERITKRLDGRWNQTIVVELNL